MRQTGKIRGKEKFCEHQFFINKEAWSHSKELTT